jgi:hypothetical protein
VKKSFVYLMVLGIIMSVGIANASELMPDFANVPTGWTTDRYEPHSFSNVGTFEGRNNVLGIEINLDEGLTSRTPGYNSSFYNTQGRQLAISGVAGSTISADLWIPGSWAFASEGNARTDMWAVMTDGVAVSGYPIIGFTNYGGAPRYRVWDDATPNGWIDLGTAVAYNAWTAFLIKFTGSDYEYFINNILVYTDSTINGSTGFSATIMQAYNFDDPSIADAVAKDYSAHWSNTQPVPIPGAVWLLGSGLLGLLGLKRRILG